MNFAERIRAKEERLAQTENNIIQGLAWIGLSSIIFWVAYLLYLMGVFS